MGSRQRPIAARNGLALAAALVLAAGCANTRVQVSSGGPQPAVSAPGSSALGALLLLGFIVSAEAHHDGARYRASPSDALSPAPYPPPPLDPARRVLEQDCTQPIEDWSANLRCR
jgi:hypothetical protein